MTKKQIKVDRLFQALGDGTRRAIVDRLSRGPVSVSQLADQLGITLTAVLQHLAILEECGLAVTEKVGRVRTCQMASAGMECPANSVPVGVRQTGMEGAWNGKAQEAHA